MSETLEWRLKLRETVSQPARRAATEMRRYEAAARKAQATEARAEAQRQRIAAGNARGVARANALAFRNDQNLRRAQVRGEQRAAQQVARMQSRAFARDQAMARARGLAEQRAAQGVARLNARAFARDEAMARSQQRAAARAANQNARAARRGADAQSSSLRSMLGTFGSVGLGIAGVAAGVAAAFGGIGLSIARTVVEVAAFRESALASLEAVLGESGAAGRVFRNSMVIANQTPLDTADAIRQSMGLAAAGFSEREITPLLAASSDIGAAFGQRSAEGFTFAIGQIRAAGQLQGQELLQLQNAGVSRAAVLASIARQMNLGTGEVGNRAAMEAIRARRVSGDVGIQAALDAVQGSSAPGGRRGLNRGRALGSFSRDQANTLTGALSNARNAVFNLLAGLDFSKIPGVQAFKNAIISITDALGSKAPATRAIVAAISSAANVAGRLFARFNAQNLGRGLALAQRGFQAVGRFATAAWPVVRAFVTGLGPGFMAAVAPLRAVLGALLSGGGPSASTMQLITAAASGLGQALGFVAGAAVTMVGTFGLVTTAISTLAGFGVGLFTSLATSLRTGSLSLGTAIVDGIVGGVTSGITRVGEAVTGLGDSALNAARNALGIHSPSKVFADRVGRQIPAGVELGITAGTPQVNSAVAGIANPRALQLGAGGGNTFTISVTVNEARSAQDTSRAVLADIEEQLGQILTRHAEAFAT